MSIVADNSVPKLINNVIDKTKDCMIHLLFSGQQFHFYKILSISTSVIIHAFQ